MTVQNFDGSAIARVAPTEMGVRVVLNANMAMTTGWFELEAAKKLSAELQEAIAKVEGEG